MLREARLAPIDPGHKRRLILNIAEREGGSGNVGGTALENAAQLRKILSERGVEVKYRLLSGESHGSSMPPTLTDAVREAFRAAGK